MGEQENKEDGKKEGEKKEELAKKEGEENRAGAGADEKKEEEAAEEIVLKVDMHCEACARKVARALKGFQGVENVTADCKASKVVVKGKTANPLKVCQRIQKKSGRKVELISPLPKPPEETTEQPPPAAAVEEKKKEEPPAVITVVLNVQMHCDACAQVLQKRIRKLKGVESVATDLASNKVTVKGIVDPEKLVSDVYKRTGKQASIVKDEEKKEEEKKDEANDKKEEIKADEEKKESSEEGEDDKKSSSSSSSDQIKRSEYWPQRYYMEYAAYPPQIFSDENPNACTVM